MLASHFPRTIEVENLTDTTYRKTVFGAKPMYESFANTDQQTARKTVNTMTSPDRRS